MKTFRFLGVVLMTVLLSVGFAACSGDNDDDDNNGGGSNGKVNTSKVFTGGLPKLIGGMQMTYNSDGTLASISGNGTRVSFEYGSGTRAVAANNTVRMTIYEDDELFATCEMTLNADGFVKSCTETDYEGDVETWAFAYNSDGQLNYMKRSEGGDEVTSITYSNGNIVKTKTVSEEDGDQNECSITYSDITNKGCIMLFDETLGIDMDEMEYAYYAGMLGKATKNLPKSCVDEDGDTTNFTWTLNSNGLPTKLTVSDSYGYNESCTFNW